MSSAERSTFIEIWRDIDDAFAVPVSPADDIADYVPTQMIAEAFRSEGFEGLVYRSSLGTGHNVMLFDIDSADLDNCSLWKTQRISFSFAQLPIENSIDVQHSASKDGVSTKDGVTWTGRDSTLERVHSSRASDDGRAVAVFYCWYSSDPMARVEVYFQCKNEDDRGRGDMLAAIALGRRLNQGKRLDPKMELGDITDKGIHDITL